MGIIIQHLETNRPSSDLVASSVSNSTFDSTALNTLPAPFLAEDFNASNFVYDNYNISNTGSGRSFWVANNVIFGMLGLERYGIGNFYFYVPVPNPENPPPVEVVDYTEEIAKPVKFWDWLTTFWNFLTDDDRDMYENVWHGMVIAGQSMIKKANRLLHAEAPENADEHVYEDFYEIQVGPLHSKPLNPDPTKSGNNYIIRPVGKILNEPEYDANLNPIYHDMIEIAASDYYKIRSIGLGCYVVVQVKKDGVPVKYFKILNLLSSEEDESSGRYYPKAGADTDRSKYKCMIVVDGNLSYIGDEQFSIYLTTGLAYDVEKWVMDLPVLQTHITEGYPIEFKLERDYTFSEHMVEFKRDIFEAKEVSDEDILYCPKAEIIEHYLYETFGNIIGIPDWIAYNHNNFSGKTAINSALLSAQNVSNIVDYRRALNAYYGLPIAPKKSKIIGLYESYGYEITNIHNDIVTVRILPGSQFHPFVQDGGRFFTEGKRDSIIFAVIDRSAGTIQLRDTSFLKVGDLLHVKLRNRFILKDVYAETETDPAYITVYSPEGHDAIQHIIDVVNGASDGKKWPEIIIYDTENLQYNFNGIYHITGADAFAGNAKIAKLTIYKKSATEEPLYNDYIGNTMLETDSALRHGSVHIAWPTHKFLLLLMDGNEYFKAYLDSPIDTIFDDEDTVDKYQILARNVSVFTKEMFMKWFQFDHFKRYNGISLESDTLEVTRALPGGSFGNYFPSGYVETK
jgi:hypothetical protein